MGLQLAGGGIELQLAQIDGAVALGIGCIHRAGGGNFPRQNLRGRSEAESRADRNVFRNAVGPVGDGESVDAGIETQALKGRAAHHSQKRIQRNVFEAGRYFAGHGDDGGRSRSAENISVATCTGCSNNLLRNPFVGGLSFCNARGPWQPGRQIHLALQLLSLAQARNHR